MKKVRELIDAAGDSSALKTELNRHCSLTGTVFSRQGAYQKERISFHKEYRSLFYNHQSLTAIYQRFLPKIQYFCPLTQPVSSA
jgi:hypothetical protein